MFLILGDLDLTLKPRKPKLYLAKPDRTIIAIISESYNQVLHIKLGNLSELTFDLPYEVSINHVIQDNPNIALAKDNFLIKLVLGDYIEWFKILKTNDTMTENSDYKSFSTLSLGSELKDKTIRSYSETSRNASHALLDVLSKFAIADTAAATTSTTNINMPSHGLSTNDYILNSTREEYRQVTYVDADNVTVSAISGQTTGDTIYKYLSWTLGTIDPVFDAKYRLFDFNSTNVLDCVFQIAEKMGAIIEWDTVNRQISLTQEDNIGSDMGLKIKYGRYLKTLNKDYDSEKLVTRLKPFGLDGLSISEVNPSGEIFIDDFTHFLDDYEEDGGGNPIASSAFISDSLAGAIVDYNSLLATKEPVTDIAEALTDTTTLVMTSHSLSVSDWIMNTDRSNAYRKVLTVPTTSTITVSAVTGQTEGDTIYKYTTGTFRKFLFDKEVLQTELTTLNNELDVLNGELTILDDAFGIIQQSASKDEAEYLSTSTLLVMTAHNMSTGHWIKNSDYSAYRAITIVDADSVSCTAVTGQAMGNTIYKYNGDPTRTDIDAKLVSIGNKETDITNKEAEITVVEGNIDSLHDAVSIDTNFTVAQQIELLPLIFEEDWENSNITDAQTLYDNAKIELAKRNSPETVLSLDIIDFLQVVSCQHDWGKLNIGDTIYIEHEKLGIDVTSKIIEATFDVENQSVQIIIANIQDFKDENEQWRELFYKSIDAKNELDIKKVNWNTTLTNFDARNDRLSTTPASPVIAVDGSALQSTLNPDGSADINFNWTFTGSTDAYNIDGFTIFIRSALTDEEYTFGSSSANEQVFNVDRLKRSFSLLGISATRHYTFGIQAYRVVDDDIDSSGILKSDIVQPTVENPYQPATDLSHNEISKNPATVIVADGSTSAARSIKSANYVVPIGSLSAQTVINTAIDSLPTVIFDLGTAQGGATSIIILATSASDTDDEYLSYTIEILGGAGSGETKIIRDYVGSTKVATVNSAWSVNPGATSTYKITSQVGKVILMEGIYIIDDSIEVNSNTTLEGQGNGTIIKQNDGASTPINMIINDNIYYGNKNINLINFSINGNRSNITDFNIGVRMRNIIDCVINNLNINNLSTVGIYIDYSSNNIISKNIIIGNGSDGIFVSETSNNNTISGNTCKLNNGVGIQIFTNSNNNTISGNILEDKGIYIYNCENNAIANNVCQNNTTYGIGLYLSSNNTVVSNTCKENSTITNDTYDNIYVDNNSNYNNIQNNTCRIADVMRENTAQAGAASTITLDASASAVNNYYNNKRIRIISGTGLGQNRLINAYVGATKVATVSVAWGTNPDNTSVFRIYDTSKLPRYGINIASADCTGNLVTNNDIYDSGASGDLNDSGTGTITTAGNRN